MAKVVIVAGDVISGFQFIGPFESDDDAELYAEAGFDGLGNIEWIVAPLASPQGVAIVQAANDR